MNNASLEGTWQMIRAELSGEAAPDLVTQQTVVGLGTDTYEVRFGGKIVDRGTYVLDAAAIQMTMVLHGSAGPNAGRTIPCLVQLKGDRLRVCYGLDGALPTEMATHSGQSRYLATYRRIA